MPEQDTQNPETAGVSVDAAELFERLRDEVERGGASGSSLRARARAAAERYWPVSAERPIERRPGLKGAIVYPVKRLLRPLMRWYVEPLAAEQRGFNDATLKLVDDLSESLDAERAARERAERLLAELEERLLRLERRPVGRAGRPSPPSRPPRPCPTTSPSRAGCAARPPRSAERQRAYVDGLPRRKARCSTCGCGRGEFLALLREAGVEARGVDADADMVAFARGEGLDVEQADAGRAPRVPRGRLARRRSSRRRSSSTCRRRCSCACWSSPRAKLRPGGVLVGRDDQPALAARAAQLLRRPHARAAARARDARAARAAGGLRGGRDALPQRAGAGRGRRPARSNEILFAPLDYAILAR